MYSGGVFMQCVIEDGKDSVILKSEAEANVIDITIGPIYMQ